MRSRRRIKISLGCQIGGSQQRNEWDACPVFFGFRAHRGSPQESGAFPAVSYARDFLPPHCVRPASLFEDH